MNQRNRLAKLLAGTRVLAPVVAGGVALAQPGDDAGDGSEDRIVRDEAAFEVAWRKADGRTGVERRTITLDLSLSDAPNEAATETSSLSVELERDLAKS